MKQRLSSLLLLAAICLLFAACSQNEADTGGEGETEDYEPTHLLSTTPLPAIPLCDETAIAFITDFNVYQTPDLAEPDPRIPFRDPVFGTCLVRVTDRRADLALAIQRDLTQRHP